MLYIKTIQVSFSAYVWPCSDDAALCVNCWGEQGSEHMMGGVFPTQVPGLLCGFYSKITIPESNLIWSAHGHFTRRAAGRTDVGEYQSELSKHGCRRKKKNKKCCSDAWGPIRLPTTGAGDNAGCATVWHNISPISWMSAWCSLDASNQGRSESQQQDDIASRWWKQQRVCGGRESAPSLTRYVRRKEKKTTTYIRLSYRY